jgi:hypothetical protein
VSIEVHHFEGEVVDSAAKSAHHESLQVAIVFVFIAVDQIEITANIHGPSDSARMSHSSWRKVILSSSS